MKEFENEFIKGAFKSQYVAAWLKAGGNLKRGGDNHVIGFDFMEWLKFIGLTDEEARSIRNYAENGKLELDESAKGFLRTR